ncbi:MAG TPA: site-specific integrase [Chitinophagaceae bacterium]|nr:site-specific integrase [Chitinophagaceae bacterium]
MAAHSLHLLFRLRKFSTQQQGTHPIYLRITLGNQRLEWSLHRQWDPLRWNHKTGKATGTKEDARELNAYLDTVRGRVFEIHRNQMAHNQTPDLALIKGELTGKQKAPKHLLLQTFKEHNDQMEKLIRRGEFARGTLVHFETTLRHTRSFLLTRYKKADIPVEDLTYAFIQEFEWYLKAEACAHNTAMKYLGDLKKIVLLCVRRGWLKQDPFQGYKMARREVVKDFLVGEELERLAQKPLTSERLTLVRDIFLFSCYTGLAYADVQKLKTSEVQIGIDGHRWLHIQRQKSGTAAAIPLLPLPLSIMDRYRTDPRCVATGRVLPVFSNQKMNAYLKELADLCGISKTLTFHTARHTFATTVTLNNDVPIESVSRMLGHKTLRQTQHYARILNKKVGQDMEVLRGKLRKEG